MKKVLFLAVALVTFFVSCGSDDDDPTPFMGVSTNKVELTDANAKDVNVDVKSNIQWTAVSAATDWCTVTPASGTNNGQITIKITANPDMTPRATKVTVKGTGFEEIIDVSQEGTSLEAVLEGKWLLADQTTGDPNWDFIEGLTLELKADKSAVAVVNLEIQEGVFVDKIEGTWSISGQTLTLNSTMMGLPVNITFAIAQVTTDAIQCTMNMSLNLLPAAGLPIIMTRVTQ